MSIAMSSAYIMAQNVSGVTPPPYPIYCHGDITAKSMMVHGIG